jgi:hypothetical protein
MPEEAIKTIFEGEIKDLKVKFFEYFRQYFSQRYKTENAENNAHLALDLIQLLAKGDEERARALLEAAFNED